MEYKELPMGIEEKAKAYDGLIERLKDLKFAYRFSPLSDTIEEKFPEIKESEDLETVKEIITYLKSVIANKGYEDKIIESWIAWLEKQGKNNMGISEATKQKLEDNLRKALKKETPESWNEYLDEQGEQKPVDKIEPKFKVGDYIERKDGLGCHAKIIFVGGNVYGCEKLIHSEDESPFFEFMFKNQDEFQISSDFKQNHADKVEPKFKVKYAGSEYNVLEVKDIAGVTYYGIEDEPNHIDYVRAENCERVDGYNIKESGSPFPTKPAKFSEQKPAENKGMNLVEGEMTPFQKKVFCIIDTTIEEEQGLKQVCDELFALASNEIEQKPAEWSEQDKKILNYLLWFYDTRFRWNDTCSDDIKFGDIVTFLKSLKNRVQPQSQWKPSEEQMKALGSAIHCYAGISPTNNREVYALEIMKEQLKKLMEE